MNFSVEVAYLLGKENNPSLCEDSIYVGEYFTAVIDGATSKSEFRFNNKKSGKIASELVNLAISKFSKKIKLAEATELINQEIYNYYQMNNIVEHMKLNKVDRFIACAAIFSSYWNEVWMIGDCQCLINGKIIKNEKLIDKILAETRALYLSLEIEKGITEEKLLKEDTGRDYILPLLRAQSMFQNQSIKKQKYAYPVFDGFVLDIRQVKVVKADIGVIILASDGYPKIFDTLEQSESYLKSIIALDPLCMKLHKTTKGITQGNISFDDRAYLKILLK